MKYDLHIHSNYSFRCSKELTFETIQGILRDKGLEEVLPDCFINIGFFPLEDKIGIQQIVDSNSVHHLLFLTSREEILKIKDILSSKSKNIEVEGRPRVSLNHQELARIFNSQRIIYGPAHAFSPTTGLFKLTSISEVYNPFFIEIGLDLTPKSLPGLIFPVVSFGDAHSTKNIGRSYTETEVPLIEKLRTRNLRQKEIFLHCCPPGYGKYSEKGCYSCKKVLELCNCEKPRKSSSSLQMVSNIPKTWISTLSQYRYGISNFFPRGQRYSPGSANTYGKLIKDVRE